MKKVLIINAHPNKESYNEALAQEYYKGCLSSKNEVAMISLRELQFDYNLSGGFHTKTELENDLKAAQEKITWAQHIVIIHPVWWGTFPAVLKAFFDRVLLPGFAFKYRQNSPLWDKLLANKTAHIIYTSDTPSFIYKWFYGKPSVKIIKNRVLGFCGIKTTKVVGIGPIRNSTPEFRQKWLNKIYKLGASVE
jgi:putative NADPH-quinone reductase